MLESLLLVVSLCIDACVASFAYGTNKIKISFASGAMLTAISTFFLAISLFLGTAIKSLIPPSLTTAICIIILLFLGVGRLFEGVLKNFLSRKALDPNHIKFNLFDFTLVLHVYTDATLADLDHSKSLSLKESIYLGVALSFDSLIVGLGIALSSINIPQILIFCILVNSLAIYTGSLLGQKVSESSNLDFSWLSGLILILLALSKLF